jgi:Xaa-Pro aminopeptidase
VTVVAATPPSIAREERLERQRALRAACERRGWPGIAIAGRGAGTYDRHGDLMWACGHYETYVGLHDRQPLWSGRSHALLLVPVDGPTTLLCATADVGADVVADEVRVARDDFAVEASTLLASLAGGGLAGLDVLPLTLACAMGLDGLADARCVVEALRRRKSAAEVALLRHACAIGTRALDALIGAAQPGATEGDAIAAAAAEVHRAGAALYVHVLSTGDALEHYASRPLPGYRAEHVLDAGDPARTDLVLVYEGYYCDFGRSWVIGGGAANPRYAEQVRALRAALDAAIGAARPGATAGDVARAGAGALSGALEPTYPPHWGHGLGMGWEGPWLVAESREPLDACTALAIEATLRGPAGIVAGEEDVLVAGGGGEVLTRTAWEAV